MSAQVIELPAVREARRRASILAEAAAFWGVDVSAVSLASGHEPDGRWWAAVAGPGGRTLAARGQASCLLAEEAARPRFVVARALVDLPPHHALEAIERALMGVAVSLPPHLRTRLYAAAAAEIGAAASSIPPTATEGTDP